jgi:hypothetical protein
MLSHDEEEYIKKLLYKLAAEKNEDDSDSKTEKETKSPNNAKSRCGSKDNPGANPDNLKSLCPKISPSQLLIIAGLLSGVLDIDSVVFNRDQTVNIVVAGSLKRQTQLDKIMEQIVKLPFEEVVRAILDSTQSK